MHSSSSAAGPASKRNLWIGRVLSGLAVLLLLLDSAGKVMRAEPSVEATVQLGYPDGSVIGIGLLLLTCVVVHLIPRTAVLGAILLTGFLGGAVASQVRAENPLFSHALFPVYIGLLVWAGLLLRDDRLRTLVPWRTPDSAARSHGQHIGVETPTGQE